MSKRWEICNTCKGDGYRVSYSEEDPYGDVDEPVKVNCHNCNGAGKVPYKSPEQKHEDYEDRKLACLEGGIAPGTDAWNEIMY